MGKEQVDFILDVKKENQDLISQGNTSFVTSSLNSVDTKIYVLLFVIKIIKEFNWIFAYAYSNSMF